MTLWCYIGDPAGWGRALYKQAIEDGISARLFSEYSREMRPDDYAFFRIPQWESECSAAKKLATSLHNHGLILIPDHFTCLSYEDKLKQAQAYSSWMPSTALFARNCHPAGANQWSADVGFPFVSKSKEGSASVNVRLVKTVEEMEREWDATMHGDGINIRVNAGHTGKQREYLIWQQFMPGNVCDYRVCINGKHLLMLQRDNAHGSPFASGSGRNRPVNEPTNHQTAALLKAQEFFDTYNLKWGGIDLVYDHDLQEWVLLEMTLGWSLKPYENCVYFGTGAWRGKDIWKVLVHGIKNGVFK